MKRKKSRVKKQKKLKKPLKISKRIPRNRREATEFPALNPNLNLKIRQAEIDYDYLYKLNNEELAWLNKFTEEYTNASLSKKHPRTNLHKNKALRKSCTDKNNARNRCILSRGNLNKGQIINLDDLVRKENGNTRNDED